MRRIALSLLALAGLIVFISRGPATATHEPANKVSAAGASVEVFGPGVAITILSESVRTSKPTDLILSVTLECAITTALTTVGNDDQTARGAVRVWVEIDGNPVKVAADDTADPGRVTFCDRTERRRTTLFDDEDATIETFHITRDANGFNWMALDVGSAVHTIAVKATLIQQQTADATALAAIGKRTLVVEPVKAANDEAVSALG